MAPRTNSDTSFAKITLPYPIFAVDFDPYNRDYVVVGGGGGESKTGVPNQISVLDVSNRAEITVTAELALSREEDSVQSLASLATRDGLITFAGINSSQAQQEAGRNEHFRSFEITYPPRKKQKTEKEDAGVAGAGTIKTISRSKFFETSTAPRKETYQRLLRLSPPNVTETGSKRIGAIATGLAKKSELIIFNATSPTPSEEHVIARITPPSEVADLDIIETTSSEFSLVYATDTDLYEQTIKYDFADKKAHMTPPRPRKIHPLVSAEDPENPAKQPKFRSVRFLNADNVLALVNRPNKGGAELQIYHVYPTGPCFQVYEKALPTRIKQATGMDVCILDEDENGNQQIVVAVAGQDISIEIYTINFKAGSDTFSFFRKYLSLKDVHEHQMTKICLSSFHPPTTTTPTSTTGKTPPKFYLRLASVSYGNTVVVDSMPLKKLDETKASSRHVLSHPDDERWQSIMWIGVGSLLVLVFAILFQPYLENLFSGKSLLPSTTDSKAILTPSKGVVKSDVQSAAAEQYANAGESVSSVIKESLPTEIPGKSKLLELIDQHLHPRRLASAHAHGYGHGHDHDHHEHGHAHSHTHDPDHTAQEIPSVDGNAQVDEEVGSQVKPPTEQKLSPPKKAIIIRPDSSDDSNNDNGDGGEKKDGSGGGITLEVHHDKEEFLRADEKARHWHELAEHEKVTWRNRLIKAGQWVEGQSEKVLMGVLFSEYGGIVGQLVG